MSHALHRTSRVRGRAAQGFLSEQEPNCRRCADENAASGRRLSADQRDALDLDQHVLPQTHVHGCWLRVRLAEHLRVRTVHLVEVLRLDHEDAAGDDAGLDRAGRLEHREEFADRLSRLLADAPARLRRCGPSGRPHLSRLGVATPTAPEGSQRTGSPTVAHARLSDRVESDDAAITAARGLVRPARGSRSSGPASGRS